jgi:SPP1 family holin
MNTKGIIAVIVAVAAVANFVLSACGIPVIPVDESAIAGVVNGLFALAGVAGTMWYNFNITEPAKVAQTVKDGILSGEISIDEAISITKDAVEKVKEVI